MSQKPSIEDDFSRRMILAAGAGGVVWAGLVARLFQLQVLESEKYQAAAEDNHIKLALAPPQRGRILDRFGKPLASHRRAGRVSIVPEQTRDPAGTLAKIAALIELPDERVEKLIKEIATSRRRNAGFVPVIVANELTYEDFASMNVHAAEIPGVQVEMALTRSYPRGRDLAHVLGYVARASQDDLDRLSVGMVDDEAKRLEKLFRHPDMRTGRQGMERFAEEWLRGKPGFRKQVTNAHGRVIEEIPDEKFAPVAGKDLYITIDSELQRAAIERFGEESGAAVVLDVETGDVLAMVSTPAFDPNDFVNGISGSAYAELRDNSRSPLYPRAHGGVYPPGSTFKMVVATAALESGAVKPTDRVHCNRYYHFGNRTWHCWKKGGHGTVDMHSAIKGSCDVYFYEIARRTGVDAIAATARKFGFGEAWTLGMTGARGGLVPDPEWKQKALGEKWYEGETLNFGIGQGQLGVTPLQLALMTARIASEGHSLKPKLVGLGPKSEQDGILDAPLDGDIMRRMKAGMYGVTSEGGGTAYRSGDLGLGGPRLAGKTGTAQVRRITQAERDKGIRTGDKIERELRDHALFVAYAPADDPKYAIAVVVEHGEGGSSTAAPLARDILHFALKNDSRRKAAYGQTASVQTPGQGEPS
ncbi:penicillin-binding protein 2 [Hyphomonas sp.]|uniref:penicillin-binding protein 2 n=1 Tax=Hyphomonas sp. TaxID=87 RepID=UPI0032EFF23E|tara:strand:- start:3711 stop:5642 length:1932 start_codon:yes stop_codon:yes gene_type:complete